MSMVAMVFGIAVEYPAFNRIAKVGCRRGGIGARKVCCTAKYFAKRYVAFTFTSRLPV
ncbi:hypothetical protein IG631_16769 [Alternaria alternata]|nr:hypothetical protein IG631_16769 [Alternaria alternata]